MTNSPTAAEALAVLAEYGKALSAVRSHQFGGYRYVEPSKAEVEMLKANQAAYLSYSKQCSDAFIRLSDFAAQHYEALASVAASLATPAPAEAVDAGDDDFKPDWASAPGETIADILEERGMSFKELADLLGLQPLSLHKLLSGEFAVTPTLAAALSRILGGSQDFWLRREAQYRVTLARLHPQPQPAPQPAIPAISIDVFVEREKGNWEGVDAVEYVRAMRAAEEVLSAALAQPQPAPDALREAAEAYRAAHALREQARTTRKEVEARFLGFSTYPDEDTKALNLALDAEDAAAHQLNTTGHALFRAALAQAEQP